MKIGGVAGLGMGIWAGFPELSRQIMHMDINGDNIYHSVQKINGDWHFLFNSAKEAAGRGAYHMQSLPGVDVAWGATKNIMNHVFQVGAVFGGMYMGTLWERAQAREAANQLNAEQAASTERAREEREYLQEQIGPREQVQTQQNIEVQNQWRQRFEGANRPVPETNQVWWLPTEYPRGNQTWMPVRITEINYDNGTVTADMLEPDRFLVIESARNQQIPLQLMVERGRESGSMAGDWLGHFGENDQVNIGDGNLMNGNLRLRGVDGLDIQPAVYKVVRQRDGEGNLRNDEVILRPEAGNDVRVNPMRLALHNVERFNAPKAGTETQEEQRTRENLPEVNAIYTRNRGVESDQMPENLRNIPQTIIVREVRDNRIIFRDHGRQNEVVPAIGLDTWRDMMKYYGYAGRQQQQGGKQKKGGGGEGHGGSN